MEDDYDYYDQDGYQRSYFEKKKSLITPYKSKYQGLKASFYENYKSNQEDKFEEKAARQSQKRTQNYFRDLEDQYQTQHQIHNSFHQNEKTNCRCTFTSVLKLISLLLFLQWLYIIHSQYQINSLKALQEAEHQKEICIKNYEKYKCQYNYYPEMETQCSSWQKCSKIDSQLLVNKQKILMEIITDVPQFLSTFMTWRSNGFLILMVLVGLVFLRIVRALK